MQRAASAMSVEWIFAWVISAISNERILQRVTSDFLQQPTSATSHEQILERITSGPLQRVTNELCNE